MTGSPARDRGTAAHFLTPAIAVRRLKLLGRAIARADLAFLTLWLEVDRLRPVRGWLAGTDAYLLYSMARVGPGRGAIVEIGSAWGRSTVFLAAGTKRAHRETVYAIDPHTGDERFLTGVGPPPPTSKSFLGWRSRAGQQTGPAQRSSLDEFTANIRRFRLGDWVKPVVMTSTAAAASVEFPSVRLLFIDGLHSYEGVSRDIQDWVPRVVPEGVIVFDDYFNREPGVGVQRAVDELLASGLVAPALRRAHSLAWTTRR